MKESKDQSTLSNISVPIPDESPLLSLKYSNPHKLIFLFWNVIWDYIFQYGHIPLMNMIMFKEHISNWELVNPIWRNIQKHLIEVKIVNLYILGSKSFHGLSILNQKMKHFVFHVFFLKKIHQSFLCLPLKDLIIGKELRMQINVHLQIT